MTWVPKRPDGWLVEEFVCSTAHLFERGRLAGHDNSPEEGDYTGVFWFVPREGRRDGPSTRRYTLKTAPKWLRILYLEATRRRGATFGQEAR